MSTNWTENNDRRIGEKTQELLYYCSQRKQDMTPQAFEHARASLSLLLDNIRDRDGEAYSGIPDTVRRSMDKQDVVVAECSEKQANALAKAIVYKYIGDDLNLYPVTAEKKISIYKKRGIGEYNIPIQEMTFKDILYVANAITRQENISKQTMQAVFVELRKYGLDPIMARVYGFYSFCSTPEAITTLPDQANYMGKYKIAAQRLVEMGYLEEVEEGKYRVTTKDFVM